MNENTDREVLGSKDFTLEWHTDKARTGILPGSVRITTGAEIYKLPWYRRTLMALIGRSHFIVYRR